MNHLSLVDTPFDVQTCLASDASMIGQNVTETDFHCVTSCSHSAIDSAYRVWHKSFPRLREFLPIPQGGVTQPRKLCLFFCHNLLPLLSLGPKTAIVTDEQQQGNDYHIGSGIGGERGARSGFPMSMRMLKQTSSQLWLSSKSWLLEFEVVVGKKGCENFTWMFNGKLG